MAEIFDIVNQLTTTTTFPCALATLVKIEGSSYRREGARRLFFADQPAIGAISGGCLEQDIDAQADVLIKSTSNCKLITYDTSSENEILWGAGTGCHGIVHVFIEKLTACPAWAHEIKRVKFHRKSISLRTVWQAARDEAVALGTTAERDEPPPEKTTLRQTINPPWRLIVFGAGDDAIPLNGLANQLGWETKIFDPRPAFADKNRFPGATTVDCEPAKTAANRVDWDDQTVAVIMTHHYRFDLPLLQTLLPLNLVYLGLLGPKERGQRLIADAGYAAASGALHYPVGLDLGGDGAESVALAIISEIQAHLHQRSGQPLRDRHHPIHGG